MSGNGFLLDEEHLRQWVLKAYHEKWRESERNREVLSAIRQFLSGAPGGENAPWSYWFEEDPRASTRRLCDDLERIRRGLARQVLEPLLAAFPEGKAPTARELASNLSVYVASLAGSLAVKTGLDETLACGLLAAALLGISRLGTAPFAEGLRPRPGET